MPRRYGRSLRSTLALRSHSSLSFFFARGRFALLIAGFLLRHLQLQRLVEVGIIQFRGSIENDLPPRRFGPDARQVGGGDLQAVEREGGALGVEAPRQHPVDDLQHSRLDGIAILQNGHELDPRHPAHEVEIAEAASAQRGRAAAHSVDFHVFALRCFFHRCLQERYPHPRGASLIESSIKHVKYGSTVYTDDAVGYDELHYRFVHDVVNHAETYVKGRVHTNGLENFWSLMKRGLKGTYVAVEPFHLDRYVDEQVFRYNNRATKDNPMTDADRFSLALGKIVGKRLTYAELTGKTSERQL